MVDADDTTIAAANLRLFADALTSTASQAHVFIYRLNLRVDG
jgi:hypothetical protein